jgi:hypothetical protein
MGNYPKALEYYERNLKITMKTQDHPLTATTYHSLISQ